MFYLCSLSEAFFTSRGRVFHTLNYLPEQSKQQHLLYMKWVWQCGDATHKSSIPTEPSFMARLLVNETKTILLTTKAFQSFIQ